MASASIKRINQEKGQEDTRKREINTKNAWVNIEEKRVDNNHLISYIESRNEKFYRKFYRRWVRIYSGNINTALHISVFWITSNNYGQYRNCFNIYSSIYY